MQGCRAFGNLHNNRSESDFRTNTKTYYTIAWPQFGHWNARKRTGWWLWRWWWHVAFERNCRWSRWTATDCRETEIGASGVRRSRISFVHCRLRRLFAKWVSANVCALYCNILNTFIRYDDANGFLRRIFILRHAVLNVELTTLNGPCTCRYVHEWLSLWLWLWYEHYYYVRVLNYSI